MDRRALLASLSALGVSVLAGCSRSLNEGIPAGSLRFENRGNLPYVIGISVVDIGTEVGTDDGYGVSGNVTVPPQQRELTAASS